MTEVDNEGETFHLQKQIEDMLSTEKSDREIAMKLQEEENSLAQRQEDVSGPREGDANLGHEVLARIAAQAEEIDLLRRQLAEKEQMDLDREVALQLWNEMRTISSTAHRGGLIRQDIPALMMSEYRNAESTQHISNVVEYWGSGSSGGGGVGWDCETAVHLQSVHQIKCPPTVSSILHMIQVSWADGWDSEGKREDRTMEGNNRWIGALEVCAILRSLGLRANVESFLQDDEDAPETSWKNLVDWVANYYAGSCDRFWREGGLSAYFTGGCSGCYILGSNLTIPVFLQHPGHSRTIFGVDTSLEQPGEKQLFVLDPCIDHQNAVGKQLKLRKLLVKQPRDVEPVPYQVVYIAHPPLLSKEEMEASKNLSEKL